ncbi:MAG: hypothetical protein LQ352_007813 [Teloschistes flavicans]|nr:MAG: hypothetical protein LQ352_007813 [Teloschistes flavicans]
MSNAVLSSPRYSPYRNDLYQPISRLDFSAYWILQHSFTNPTAPSTSDIVLLYFHGGGYFTSQPAHYLLFLLRLTESIIEHDKSVSILALDYGLVPEHPFPSQLAEAAAAYNYLLHEAHVPAEKIVIAGDSAGGHLALSLLVHLQSPLAGISAAADNCPKPGGLLLLSPWLSLKKETSTFTTNTASDFISGPFLHRAGRRVLEGWSRSQSYPAADSSPYVEFLDPTPTIDWEAVLPSRISVFTGSDEVMLDSILQWIDTVRTVLGKERVALRIGEGKVHIWQ